MNFLIVLLVLVAWSYLRERPPIFVLNFFATRLHQKTLVKLEKSLRRERIWEKDKSEEDFVKKASKETRVNLTKEIKEVKETRDKVYKLIAKYQDNNKNYRRVLQAWYGYLKLEYEYVEAWDFTGEYGVLVLDYADLRKLGILTEAYRKLIKEWLENVDMLED